MNCHMAKFKAHAENEITGNDNDTRGVLTTGSTTTSGAPGNSSALISQPGLFKQHWESTISSFAVQVQKVHMTVLLLAATQPYVIVTVYCKCAQSKRCLWWLPQLRGIHSHDIRMNYTYPIAWEFHYLLQTCATNLKDR